MYQVLDPRKPTPFPKLRPFLTEWLNHSFKGKWFTARDDGKKIIATSDKSILLLFKLTWQGHPDITPSGFMGDAAAFYAPYVPLVATSTINKSEDDTEQDPL
jgi:hypothetical protein